MSEVMFVLKSLGLALIFTMLMQIQVGESSIETKAEVWIRTSSISKYLRGVADGAVKAVKTASKSVSHMINAKSSQNIQESETERASKWNFNFNHNRDSDSNSDERE